MYNKYGLAYYQNTRANAYQTKQPTRFEKKYLFHQKVHKQYYSTDVFTILSWDRFPITFIPPAHRVSCRGISHTCHSSSTTPVLILTQSSLFLSSRLFQYLSFSFSAWTSSTSPVTSTFGSSSRIKLKEMKVCKINFQHWQVNAQACKGYKIKQKFKVLL